MDFGLRFIPSRPSSLYIPMKTVQVNIVDRYISLSLRLQTAHLKIIKSTITVTVIAITMGSTSAWGTRRMRMQMVMVAITAFMLFINLPVQVQGAGETDHPDVVDAEGNPVQVGGEYYVLPAVVGSGGGLTLKMRVNNSCPLYVAQEDSEKSRGLPVVFRPAKGQTGNYSSVIVQEHVNLNVNMAAESTCVQSTAWSVENDANTTKRFIKASDSSSLFQIVKAIDGDGYVLYFCPCNCRLVCTTVGIYVDDDENRWLVIDNSAEALRVQFQKNE